MYHPFLDSSMFSENVQDSLKECQNTNEENLANNNFSLSSSVIASSAIPFTDCRNKNWPDSVELLWFDLQVCSQGRKSTRCGKLGNMFCKPLRSKVILRNCFGLARPGRLLAIMGSSGAGKTTLLNALSHYSGDDVISGTILVNGTDIGRAIRTVSAYVHQDDVFMGTLTVKEHLMFQGRLRFPRNFTQAEVEFRVEEVIKLLGLNKCRNNTIGIAGRVQGISGGEKRRLSFASEILTDPPLLLCDEPTSGLDSFMAHQVVILLKKFALSGKTVICTIHQPSSIIFSYFDDLCLLANGRTAYFGSCTDAMSFFANIGMPCPTNFNAADHYIKCLSCFPGKELECQHHIKRVARKFENSACYAELKYVFLAAHTSKMSFKQLKDMKPTCIVPWRTQFRTLCWRNLLNLIREPLMLKIRVYQNVSTALIIGLLYWQSATSASNIQNINGILFLFANNMVFGFVFGVIEVFCAELPIFLREYMSCLYRVDAYYLSKTLTEVPQYLFYPCIFTSILYWMAGLYQSADAFFMALLINILCANASVSLGYMISTMFADVSLTLSISPIIVIPGLLFSGIYINQQTIPMYFDWLKYLSIFKYAYEALAINQWERIGNISISNNTESYDGIVVLQSVGLNPDNLFMDISALLALIFSLRLIAFLFLITRVFIFCY